MTDARSLYEEMFYEAYPTSNEGSWARAAREFDETLAAHDAEVAANALREVADSTAAVALGSYGRSWIRARADRIEREAADRKSSPELGSSESERGER